MKQNNQPITKKDFLNGLMDFFENVTVPYLEKHIEKRLDDHDKRFDEIDKRFDEIDKKLEEHDRRFDKLDDRLDRHGKQLESHEEKISLLKSPTGIS